MLAIYLSPIYAAFNIFAMYLLVKWCHLIHPVFKKKRTIFVICLVYVFFAITMGLAYVWPIGKIARILKLLGNYWLGISLYLVSFVLLALLIWYLFIWRRAKKWEPEKRAHAYQILGGVTIFCIAAVSLYGAINARFIHTTKYEVEVNKDGGKLDQLNLVLIADIHLGYNIGCKHVQQMVDKINAANPDIVVIAGDFFDNEYDALDDPKKLSEILRGIKTKYGVYATYGNHDVKERLLAGFAFGLDEKKESDPRMDQFIKDSNIYLMTDESVLIDDSFYLIGRVDNENPGRGIDERKSIEELVRGLDMSIPIINVEHEPVELQKAVDAGVDIDLNGHVHDGQCFPANIVTDIIWENPCGYLKKGQMHSIVTSGAGLFGPNMRVGTICEICDIKVKFTK